MQRNNRLLTSQTGPRAIRTRAGPDGLQANMLYANMLYAYMLYAYMM